MKIYLVIRSTLDSPEWSIIKAFTSEDLAKEYLTQFEDHHAEDVGGGDWHEYTIEELEVVDYVPKVRWIKRYQDYKDLDTKEYLFEK